MDASEFTAAVERATATELDRLGSEKSLVASTNARLDTEHVLAAAARSEARAAETFEQWAGDESDETVRTTFGRVADAERDHRERIVAHLDESASVATAADVDPLHEHLRGLDDTVERVAAGMVARPLVASRSLLQVINFFINEADESSANVFRDLRAETEAMADEGAELLEPLCESDADWERAETAAVETVAVAYEAYAETLEGMGVDPKPVC
ncbi:rubrerythrin family protein [Halomarina rubra]|uniref:Rubrerythrin family protein n=1 Tax=Halomarina rubra TaxID=2071873 RepID=A0ABD6AU24_9EURY|nr:rubrerythrin family protein [Halomarina rubra]